MTDGRKLHSGPLVSVCLPTYNGAAYIAETLECIKKQTYANLEVIVSDDHSKDATLDLVMAFKSQAGFPVHVFHHEPGGLAANFNHCIDKANGEFIKFLFQDDLIVPSCIEEMVAVLDGDPRIGLVGSKRNLLVEESTVSAETERFIGEYGDLQRNLEKGSGENLRLTKRDMKKPKFHIPPLNKVGEPSTVMFRKKLVDELGLFRTDLKMNLDFEYWYRILARHDILILDKPLSTFRIHPQQATSSPAGARANEWDTYNRILLKRHFILLPFRKQVSLLFHYTRTGDAVKRMVKLCRDKK